MPALSTYLLIALTIIDIFLFIYFLHYITQSVKYGTIIHRIHKQTKEVLEQNCPDKTKTNNDNQLIDGNVLAAKDSGVFQGFDKNSLLNFCKKENAVVQFTIPPGNFVLKGTPLLVTSGLQEEHIHQLWVLINIHQGNEIATNYFYGFKQLMEVAIKALSPGINDPGTAVLSLYALTDLLAYRVNHLPANLIHDDEGAIRIITKERTFEELFTISILPIWDYGKKDRLILTELCDVLLQLQTSKPNTLVASLLNLANEAIAKKEI